MKKIIAGNKLFQQKWQEIPKATIDTVGITENSCS